MRMSLIVFGVIFLVLGGLLYFVPLQELKANTTSTEGGDTDVRTSTAKLSVPVEWAYSSIVIGFVLLVLGFTIPGALRNSNKDSYENVVESKENIRVGDGNKREIVRERTEHHRKR